MNHEIRLVLHHSLHLTFTAMFVIALGTVISMLFMPKIEIGHARGTVETVGATDAKNAANQAFH
jgi:hypothetical protein